VRSIVRVVYAAGALAAGFCFVLSVPNATAQSTVLPTFTAAQAQRGEASYVSQCAQCHGRDLDNGEFAVPLKGPEFVQHWAGGRLDELFNHITQKMPPTNPGGLDLSTYVDVMAYILSQNGIAPSETELPADPAVLKSMAFPK